MSQLEEFLFKFRFQTLLIIFGLLLIGLGVVIGSKMFGGSSSKIEVLNSDNGGKEDKSQVITEISGEVEKPGVYRLANDARIEDLLIVAGGLSENADRAWVEKSLNRAAKLVDGQKVFIPPINQSSPPSANNLVQYQNVSSVLDNQGSGLVNINAAGLKELDALPGIGPVYAQNIIDHRPYSSSEDLVQKKVVPKNVYEKIKEKVTTY
jgi:competence protein ComEA